jgi:hypothetical protein
MNDVKGVLPPGVIRYQTEKGWYQEFIVDPPSWTWSEGLGVASLVLAVIAIPVTGGASVVLVVGAAATGIASSGFYMYEENLKGQLSTGEVWRESGFMVANLLPMVRGISTIAKLSKTSGILGKMGMIAEGYNYLKVSVGVGLGATAIDGVIIADEYISKFDAIDKLQISNQEKDAKREHLLREGLITGFIALTGLLDLTSLKKPHSNSSKHWSGPDVPVPGKNKSSSIVNAADGATSTTHELTGGIEPTGTKQLTGSTQQSTVSSKKKTTKVVVAQDGEGNFHKQNQETGEFEKISKEEFDQLELTTKNKGGEVVKSEESSKQIKTISDVESGKTKLKDYGEKVGNQTRPGNYGEMKMDHYFEGLTEINGRPVELKRISKDRIIDIDEKGHQGIDGVYENLKYPPPPKYIIAESKYGKSPLSKDSKDGPQMSDDWIEGSNRLSKAVGEKKADDILLEGYERVLIKVKEGGTTSAHKLDSGGNKIGSWP